MANLLQRTHLALPAPQLCVAGVPVYLERAEERLAIQALELERALTRWRQQQQLAASATRRRPDRAALMQNLAEAFAANVRLLDRVRACLLPALSADAVLRVFEGAPMDSAYGAEGLIAHLRRDWSHEPECEAELEGLLAATRGELQSAGIRGGRALVLGAGLGRLAEEVAGMGFKTHAVELAAPLAIAAALVRKGPLEAYCIQTRNAYRALDQARRFEAHWVAGDGRQAAQPLIADATALPHGNESVDVVISVYFTDVVPPKKLIPEIRRVLRRGGQFVHVGPLGYHAPDAADHLAADDLLDEFRLHGFQVSEPRWIEGTHHLQTVSMHECRFHNLVFSATSDRLVVARPIAPAGPCVPFIA